MRNNTIEVKLNSYGTLEVVSIPVKLYKDSYNVVKLRVNAPMVADSMLKVYLGDEDESGEKVWASKTYSWLVKETCVIGGASYNVYEEYIPQEFCSESGDIRITFAQVVSKDEVNQILTSGSLNLYISGDGFNYNGVEISDADKLAIKINEVLSYYKDYDLKIRSQAEFNEFYESLINGTCSASSVLFVGDGGELEFVATVTDKPVVLPKTLKVLNGINSPKIRLIRNFNYNVDGWAYLQYSEWQEAENKAEYCISGIGFILENSKNTRGLYRVQNVYNCSVETIGEQPDEGYMFGAITNGDGIVGCDIKTTTMRALDGCKNIVDCTGNMIFNCINIANCNVTQVAQCENVFNVEAKLIGSSKNLVNCKVSAAENVGATICYNRCENLNNCYSYMSTSNNVADYYYCKNLSNCITTGERNAFSYCDYLSNCRGETKEARFSSCTNISATHEDTKAYVDTQIGDFANLLEEINSGEGV